MKSPFHAKYINDSIFIEDLAINVALEHYYVTRGLIIDIVTCKDQKENVHIMDKRLSQYNKYILDRCM